MKLATIFRISKCDFPSVQNLRYIYWIVENVWAAEHQVKE